MDVANTERFTVIAHKIAVAMLHLLVLLELLEFLVGHSCCIQVIDYYVDSRCQICQEWSCSICPSSFQSAGCFPRKKNTLSCQCGERFTDAKDIAGLGVHAT